MKSLLRKSFVLAVVIVAMLLVTVPAHADPKNSEEALASGYTLEEWVLLNIENNEDTIDISAYGIPRSNTEFYFGLIKNHPELIYMDGSFSYNTDYDYYTDIYPMYSSQYSEQDLKTFNNKVNSILAGVDKNWTDFQIILYIHDYIVDHCRYWATESGNDLSNYNAYGALVRGYCVCEGYSSAFKLLMDRLGIPCEVIISDYACHQWNAVKVGGNYYYIDVTTDDQITRCVHSRFLVTRAELEKNNEIYTGKDWLKGDYTDAYNTIKTGSSLMSGARSFIYSVESPVTISGKNIYYQKNCYYDTDGAMVVSVGCHDESSGKNTELFFYKTEESTHYTGSVISPALTVETTGGAKIAKDKYTVTCSSTIKNVGTYNVLLSLKAHSAMKVKVKLTVNPPKTAVKKLTKGKKSFKVTWTKKTAQVDGYEIQYSLKKNFSGSKKAKVTGCKKASTTVKKLKAKKTYYVRVRTYKKVGKKTYYSAWSGKKKVKTS